MNPPTSSSGEAELSLPDIIVLDACVLLNLYACERVEEILATLACRCLVSPHVCGEALWYLAPPENENKAPTRRDIALEPLIASDLLTIVHLTPEEQTTFVEFAQQLGDGEAACGALAISRSAAVATDDFKARQLFGRLRPPLRTIGTATLLRCWEERSRANPTEVATALRSIRRGARYSPRGDDADSAWWQERVQEVSLP